MTREVIELPPMRQAAAVRSINEDQRSCEVVFTTGDLVPHMMPDKGDYRVVLTRVVVEQNRARLDRLNAGAPVLDAHSTYSAQDIVGVVERAWIEAGTGRAILRFARDPGADAVWQKVRDGVLRAVSMGFFIHEVEQSAEIVDGEEQEVWRITDWEPFEISVVAIGADRGARVQNGPETSRAVIVRKEQKMTDKSKAPAAVQPENEAVTQAATQSAPIDLDAVRREAAEAERKRVLAIRQTGARLGLDETFIQSAIEAGTEIDAFRAQAIEAFGAKSGVPSRAAGDTVTQGANIGHARATVTADERERFIQGAALGIMKRAGLNGGERNEFTGLRLEDIARQALAIGGAPARGTSRMDIVGQAFVQAGGGHSTSDFANVLSNVMGKAALQGWEEAEETWQKWCKIGTLTDFKPTKRVGTGVFSTLSRVDEGAEYTYGTMGDRGEPITLATYGRLLKITRQAIINDDLSLLADAPRKMGMAARRTIGNLVYSVLTSNPVMSDGVALFDAQHKNLAASGSALSVTALADARAKMMTQTDGDASALNIRPRYLIVPAALETIAQQLMTSIVDPTAQKGHASNPVAGMAEVVADARLDAASATAWYLAANPAMFDTIEVAFLDGVQEPYIEEKTGWSIDGAELKVRIDAGVAPLDYRTLYKNPGA